MVPLICLCVIELTPFGSVLATSFTSDCHYVPLLDHCDRRVEPCHVHVSHLRHCQVRVNLKTVSEYDRLLLLLLVILSQYLLRQMFGLSSHSTQNIYVSIAGLGRCGSSRDELRELVADKCTLLEAKQVEALGLCY